MKVCRRFTLAREKAGVLSLCWDAMTVIDVPASGLDQCPQGKNNQSFTLQVASGC